MDETLKSERSVFHIYAQSTWFQLEVIIVTCFCSYVFDVFSHILEKGKMLVDEEIRKLVWMLEKLLISPNNVVLKVGI